MHGGSRWVLIISIVFFWATIFRVTCNWLLKCCRCLVQALLQQFQKWEGRPLAPWQELIEALFSDKQDIRNMQWRILTAVQPIAWKFRWVWCKKYYLNSPNSSTSGIKKERIRLLKSVSKLLIKYTMKPQQWKCADIHCAASYGTHETWLLIILLIAHTM